MAGQERKDVTTERHRFDFDEKNEKHYVAWINILFFPKILLERKHPYSFLNSYHLTEKCGL